MAQDLYIFRQGESKRLVIELKDRLGANFPLTTATQIKAQVYIQGKDTKVTFALTPAGTEIALFVNADDNWKIDIPLDRDQSKLLDAGILLVDVVVKVPDAGMIDGDGVVEFAPINAGSLEKGYFKDATI